MKVPKNSGEIETIVVPIVPTMDVVVFPRMIVPLLVVDENIIAGIEGALKESPPKHIFLVASRKNFPENSDETIGPEDLYEMGTVASVMRVIQIPNGGIKILINGLYRAKKNSIQTTDQILNATIEKVPFGEFDQLIAKEMIEKIKASTQKYLSAGSSISPDFGTILGKIEEPEKIADFIISHISLPVEKAQDLLETVDFISFLQKLHDYFLEELENSQTQESIKQTTRDSINKSQKEYYLREQLKAIKKELGDTDSTEIEALVKKAETLNFTPEARKEFDRSVSRLEKMTSDSMEASVIRSYLELMVSLPWDIETTDNLDLDHARKILDQEHYGLDEIKERILDFISVRNLKKDGQAPILCLVGPPGTGKTSLGKSIADCLGRKYRRISLGGVRDEAEIRGHRKTYVGAMPGRFIQAMQKAQSCNPVIIIDEIDKLGTDFKGDPSAAMLEILDPSQNNAFYDNYLGVTFDLSKVLFVATANSLETLSEPLRDRMEIITFSGYTAEEKSEIAKRHILAKAFSQAGLDHDACTIEGGVLAEIIRNYTREAGVRELERLIRKIASKAARLMVEKGEKLSCTKEMLEVYLGPRKFIDDTIDRKHQIGIANGLAWTAYGGEIIQIEAMTMPGSGKLTITGHLGEVMKESIQAALSYVRAHAEEFLINQKLFLDHDLHVHVPAGAVPKDGPSAGITMLSAILSAYTNRPINAEYAMTGEINLRGCVMPIGGLKEKILAAKRNGVSHIILPEKNKPEIFGMEDVTDGIDIIWVSHANDILKYILMPEVVIVQKSVMSNVQGLRE